MKNPFKHAKLKRLLSKSFPGKKITITDNKDGSQTISIKQVYECNNACKGKQFINNFSKLNLL